MTDAGFQPERTYVITLNSGLLVRLVLCRNILERGTASIRSTAQIRLDRERLSFDDDCNQQSAVPRSKMLMVKYYVFYHFSGGTG